MMKHAAPQPHRLAELAGWYGASAIMAGYILVSFEILNANSVYYQLLNLTGALGIIVIAKVKHVRQSIVLNIFWIAIACLALGKIALSD